MKRLVLLGGGHAHLFVLEAFAKAPLTGVELVLINPARLAPYSGMMPGVIAGHYRYEQGCVDLVPLCRVGKCRLQLTRATAVDPTQRHVICEDGSSFGYDLLSIDTGATPSTFGIPGVTAHAHPVKPIDRFIEQWRTFCESREATQPVRIAIVGGGAAGFEVLLAMHYRLLRQRTKDTTDVCTCHLISDMPCVLPGFPLGARRRAECALAADGIILHTGSPVVRIEADTVILADGEPVHADFIGWATGPAAPAWPRASRLAVDERGFILVDTHLRSVSNENVFAAGDVATMYGEPRPKAGVYAVRAGPPLARNLRAALRGEPLQSYVPQRQALSLISTGDRYAMGHWGPLSWEGRWAWRWKDRIDRRFIARFSSP